MAAMIELAGDTLVFSFPEVFPGARLSISFQRTLRIPDDGKAHPLPAGLGDLPLRHVDDFGSSVPAGWKQRGGVMMPMYQSEATWISFRSYGVPHRESPYPFAVKIGTGRIDAITGKRWRDGLLKTRQDYLIVPEQPWLDGYVVDKGLIRQFVAMPLGAGYTAEEQITGKAGYGGLQICVIPMKPDLFEKLFPLRSEEYLRTMMPARYTDDEGNVVWSVGFVSMGLAPGGLMEQEIYLDEFGRDAWETSVSSRCFVHIANSLVWRAVTGEAPPQPPLTSKEYRQAGVPWFKYYHEGLEAVEGSKELAELKSVIRMGREKGDVPVPENETSDPVRVIELGPKGRSRVSEW
ncbi:hypothetical protein JW921_04220 [Candidatus Fermentibacterales bacterium]|nr:hypothetical protein [Candidatus Fermentibacterales bacterium]